MIISPHGNRSVTPQQRTTFSDRVIRSQGTPRNSRNNPVFAPPPPPVPQASFTCWDGSLVFGPGQCPGQSVAAAPPSFSGTTSAGFSNSAGVPPGGRIAPIFETVTETVVVQPASVEYVSVPAQYETVYETIVIQEASTELVNVNGTMQERVIPAVTKEEARRRIKTPASTVERIIPAVTKQISRRVVKTPAAARGGGGVSAQTGSSNALNESMLSGSKTIRVSATLSYNYETPLDGVIFKVPEEE